MVRIPALLVSALSGVALLTGCSSTPPTDPLRSTDVPGDLADGGMVQTSSVAVGAPVNLTAAGPDYVIASTSTGPFRLLTGQTPILMPLVDSNAGESFNVGPFSAMTSRQGLPVDSPVTGVLALGSAGILEDYTDFFEVSALQTAVSEPVSALDDYLGKDGEEIWLAIPGGAVRVGALSTQTFQVQGERSITPTALAVVDDKLALIAFGGTIADLYYADGSAALVEFDFGSIHAMTRGASGTALIGTDRGLYVRNADGTYTHYPLSSGTPLAVTGVGFDPLSGAFAAAGDSLVSLPLSGGGPVAIGAFPITGEHAISVDGFGNVWGGAGSSAVTFQSGTPVGYANNVKPFFAAYCYRCHVTGSMGGSPRLPFDDYEGTVALASTIVDRLTGANGVQQMPPAPPLWTGPLPPDTYAVVIRWVKTGELP